MKSIEELQEKSYKSKEELINQEKQDIIEDLDKTISDINKSIETASETGRLSVVAYVNSLFSDRIFKGLSNRGFYVVNHYMIPIFTSRHKGNGQDSFFISWDPKDLAKLNHESKVHKWFRRHNILFNEYNTMQIMFSILVTPFIIIAGVVVVCCVAKIFGIDIQI